MRFYWLFRACTSSNMYNLNLTFDFIQSHETLNPDSGSYFINNFHAGLSQQWPFEKGKKKITSSLDSRDFSAPLNPFWKRVPHKNKLGEWAEKNTQSDPFAVLWGCSRATHIRGSVRVADERDLQHAMAVHGARERFHQHFPLFFFYFFFPFIFHTCLVH